jgi:hypothetical protein
MDSKGKKALALGVVLLLVAGMIVLGNREQGVGMSEQDSETTEDAPLLFATMTHMEGNWEFVEKKESMFAEQAELLRIGMDYAKEYDAVLTFESEMPFARAMAKWGDNVFQEALDRGMGIGTHCDIYPRTRLSTDEIIEEFAMRKELIDALVDPSENLGCAGGGGLSDWYLGSVGAGFKYIDGIVGYHWLAVDPSKRPDGWDNKAIFASKFHDPVPAEDERYYPVRVGTVGFASDVDGELVVSSGDIGEISSIGETEGSDTWGASCGSDCPVNAKDVQVLIKKIREFDQRRDKSRVAKMQVYIPSSKFADPGIEIFFASLQELQDHGVIEWASQKQVYETFIAWE